MSSRKCSSSVFSLTPQKSVVPSLSGDRHSTENVQLQATNITNVNKHKLQFDIQIMPTEMDAMQKKQALFNESSKRTENEQQLYNAWKLAESQRDEVANNMNQLHLEIKKLQKANEEMYLKYTELESKLGKKDTMIVEYHTDEEELAEETGWIRKKNKKRKMNTSLTPPRENQNVSTAADKKVQPPPPIMVDGIDNFNAFHEKIKNIVPTFKIKVISDKSFKINTENMESFRKATNVLNESSYSWHSYENKQIRPIKVIVKRLHHSCQPEDIIGDLRNRFYTIQDATPKLKYRTKQPLNMFMLTFEHDEHVDKIYKITDIMGIRVEIVPLKKSKLVPQCKRCQSYGHTARYCAKEPRCVRCTAKHLTSECDKSKNTQPKCVHCGEGHPANYRGCMVAKEIQKLRNKTIAKPNLPQQPERNPKPEAKANTSTKPRTYGQVLAGNFQVSKNQQNNSIEQTLQQILEKLTKLDDRITKLEVSAKRAIPGTSNA